MRPNISRGKRKDNGEWVYGDYVEYVFLSQKRYCIVDVVYNSKENYLPLVKRVVSVDPSTVGQFTGLHDNKRTKEYPEGREIYVGDKVQMTGNSTQYVVEYKAEDGGYYPFVSNRISGLVAAEYEVIGTIHDNPEQEPIQPCGPFRS